MNLTSRTAWLVWLAHRDPKLWEIIHPHVPVMSEGTRQVWAAMIIKSVANEISNREAKLDLQEMAKKLFSIGTRAMNYDDDGWCGTPWPHHFPIPDPHPDPWNWMSRGDETMLNPQPLPPRETYYGAILTLLADGISSREIGARLKNIGASLIKANGNFTEKEAQKTFGEKKQATQ